jgi:hypothetical protein
MMKKDHTDYSARTKTIKRFHPDRKLGESTGNVMDARADESLYKPLNLGRAACSVRYVLAGANQPFELEYYIGPRGVFEGELVKFWMPGQGSLGDTPQIDNPDIPGYLEYRLPSGIEVESFCEKYRVLSIKDGENPKREILDDDKLVGPISIGFRLISGKLVNGDCITISVGRKHGFIWKKLAARKEFKLILEPADNSPKMRLPEPVRIDIIPLEADHLDIFIGGSGEVGSRIRGVVSIRDKYDNKVDYSGPIDIKSEGQKQTVYLSNGLGIFHAEKRNAVLRVKVLSSPELNLPASESNAAANSKDGMNLFFGDMHTHDFNSTAEGYPSDCYMWGRDQKRLDFQALAAQVHRWIDNEKWFLMKHMAEYFLDEGNYVTFLSFEWQHSSCGDKIVHYIGNDMPFLSLDMSEYDSPDKFYAAVKQTDAFIISHHPGYCLDLHVPGARWDVMDTEIDRLVEIWSMHGSSEGYDERDRPLIPPYRKAGVRQGLTEGLRVGLVGGSDTHTARPGGSSDDVRPYYGGLCAIWAKDLTRRGLYEAFMARRTYAITGARINLYFSVNNAVMGSEIPMTDKVEIKIDVLGTKVISKIEIMKDGFVHKTFNPDKRDINIVWCDELTAPALYHCRITQVDGHVAVATPVWVG